MSPNDSVWVKVGEEPPIVFYQGVPPAVAGALLLPCLRRVGQIRRPLSVPGLSSAETASVTIDLDNAAGAVSARFAPHPPARWPASVHSAAGELFSGVVTRCTLGVSASLSIESGIRQPLTDALPLRTSVVWGGYQNVRVLPVVYGSARLSPVPYDAAGRWFVLADHSIAGVDAVTRDSAPTSAWAFHNGLDSTGHAVAFLELATPLATGEALAVTLRGKRQASSGKLLTSPAEIMHDVLAEVCSLPIPWPRFDRFRAQTAGLVLGGALNNAQQSIRATLDQLLSSVGAAWSAGAEDIALLYPGADTGGRIALTATPLTAREVSAECAHDKIVTALRVVYDYDHALGKPRRALALECPEAIRRYGRIEQEWNAAWLRSPREAQALGERLLAWMCRPRWRVRWQQAGGAGVKPGDLAALAHPFSPLTGPYRLLTADLDIDALLLHCAVEAPVGEAPKLITTALSTAFEPILVTGATVDYQNGTAILTLLDDAGQPLSGAKATFDGSITRLADNAGRVSFPAARGQHTVRVEATGYAPMDLEITV
jgi:hypothetical protein